MRKNAARTKSYTCAVCGAEFSHPPYYAGIERRGEDWVSVPTCSKECQRARLTQSTQRKEATERGVLDTLPTQAAVIQ